MAEQEHLSERDQKRLEVLLLDYERCKEEVLSLQTAHRRVVGIVVAAIGLGLPVVYRSLENDVSDQYVKLILLCLAFLSLFVGYIYVGYIRAIQHTSTYIKKRIIPKVNEIAGNQSASDNAGDLLQWPIYIQKERGRGVVNFLAFSLPHLGQVLPVAGLSLASLVAAWTYGGGENKTVVYALTIAYSVFALGPIIILGNTIWKDQAGS